MPSYVLICTICHKTLDEMIRTIAERETMTCECGGELTNDYERMKTGPGFTLKGGNWPGKANLLEGKILRERNSD